MSETDKPRRAYRSPAVDNLARYRHDAAPQEPTPKEPTPRVAWLMSLVRAGAFTGGKTHGGKLRYDIIDPDTHRVIRAEVRRATA